MNARPSQLLPGLVALGGGIVFAFGLCLSGMTQPEKVLGFLDVSRIPSGGWDPSLAFVMIGAIGVHFAFARRARLGKAPLLAAKNELPTATKGLAGLDAGLFAGAALFGLGWGIAGFCPGPAVVSLVTGASPTVVFVAAMVAGMALHSSWTGWATGSRRSIKNAMPRSASS